MPIAAVTNHPTSSSPSSQSALSCLSLNADTLSNKIDELKSLVCTINPDIIAITEIYPKRSRFSMEDCEIQIENYDTFRTPQTPNTRGCALLIHTSLKANLVDLQHEYKDQIWCSIKLQGKDTLLISCVYRHHDARGEDHMIFMDMLDKGIQTNHTHLLITGDFNLPNIVWPTCIPKKGNLTETEQAFIDLIRDKYLYQHIDKPTRYRQNQSANILDLILTNEEDMVTDIEHLSPLGSSDHCTLSFKFNCYSNQTNCHSQKPIYDKGN